jgi:hypothetical protein
LGRPDGHQHAAAIEPARNPLGVVHGHGIDQGAAALNVVDAKIVDLDLGELHCNLAGRVKRQRVGTFEK